MLKKNRDALDEQSWCGLNRPQMKETEADCVIFGIPFDEGVSYRGSPPGKYEALNTMYRKTLLL